MNRSFYGSRLIPRIADAVRESRTPNRDESSIDAAIDKAITHHTGNPLLHEKQHGRSDFADHARQLVEHRTTKMGFYLPHGYDVSHNRRVKHADELFPYDTTHTRKNGVKGVFTHSEVFLVGAATVVLGTVIGGAGYLLDDQWGTGGLDPNTWGVGLAVSSGLVPPLSDAPLHSVNDAYRRVGQQADAVWDTYVEERDYDADVEAPSMPFDYVHVDSYREPRLPSLTSSKA